MIKKPFIIHEKCFWYNITPFDLHYCVFHLSEHVNNKYQYILRKGDVYFLTVYNIIVFFNTTRLVRYSMWYWKCKKRIQTKTQCKYIWFLSHTSMLFNHTWSMSNDWRNDITFRLQSHTTVDSSRISFVRDCKNIIIALYVSSV